MASRLSHFHETPTRKLLAPRQIYLNPNSRGGKIAIMAYCFSQIFGKSIEHFHLITCHRNRDQEPASGGGMQRYW